MTTEGTVLDDETLVAYLDGELPTSQAAEIKMRIASDPQLQQRAKELQASWNLLDELPRVNCNPQLAQSTIELVTQGVVHSQLNRSVRRKILSWASIPTVLIASMILGAWVSLHQRHLTEQAIVDDLFVLTHFRELDYLDSEQWLDRLASIENLEKAGLALYTPAGYSDLPTRRKQLKSWSEALESSQKQQLQSTLRKFELLPAERKTVLRNLANKLKTDQAKDQLDRVKAYAGLLNKIGTTEAIHIGGEKDLDRRSKELTKVIQRILAINYPLNDDEKSHIADWCDRLKQSNFHFLNLEDPDAEIILTIDIESPSDQIQAQDIHNLIECIEQPGRLLLDSIEPTFQTKVLKLWIINSLPTMQPKPKFSSGELLERFRQLSTSSQNELIYLPSAEVIKKVGNSPSP